MVGFITAITDHVLSVYIPLLEVLPPYQGQGVCTQIDQNQVSLPVPEVLMKVGHALQERGLYADEIALYQYIAQKFPKLSKSYEALYQLNMTLHKMEETFGAGVIWRVE
ncbi:MAG: hypothetical protein AAF921_21205 [Cyanobacteria bacterium P01_D01_bin.44]